MIDPFGRCINYLRVSVTDRCDFRCVYCMSEDMTFLPKSEILTLEELDRVCSAFIRKGVRRLRLTGGEPLVRPGVEDFIAQLSSQGAFEEISITTNGLTLGERAQALKAAGASRVNVSVDSLQAERFDRITRTKGTLRRVLEGIEAAQAVGLNPVKVNAVVVRGFNDDEIVDFAKFAIQRGLVMRFIEFMLRLLILSASPFFRASCRSR